MRAAISLLVLLLSMCGVQTESHGSDASTQDVSTELKELRDMVVELRVTLQHTRDDVKVLETENVAMKQRLAVSETKVEVLDAENKAVKERLAVSEADNVAMKQRLAASESKVDALERTLQNTKADMKMEEDNLKKKNAAQEAELTAVKTGLATTETKVENLETEIKAAPKVAFSAGLGGGSAFIEAGSNDLNLVFKRVITNVGQAYSDTSGFFTAPVRGVYYIRFTVMDKLSSRWMGISMHKNGVQLVKIWEHDTDGYETFLSSGLTLLLEKGDKVNMVLPKGYRLVDSANNPSNLSGFLLFPLNA